MKKRNAFLVIALMMLFGLNINITNVKAKTITYDYKDTMFGTRTKEEVAKEYSKAINAGSDTYDPLNSDTYYSQKASTKSPYDQGVLTNDTLSSMEGMTNFFRYLAGVEALQEKCTQNESLQYQALDRNFEFGHYISNSSKPEDMSDELWQKGYKCDHNIIAMGYTPSGAITGWINEGYDLRTKTWDTLGHRYALISADPSNIQFGYCGNVAVGKNCEAKNPDLAEVFSAYPQAGYMPNKLVNASECAWSVELNDAKVKISNISKVNVKVTNLSTNNSYTCTKADNTAKLYTTDILQFVQPSDATNGRYTDNYKVEITGLTDVATGDDASITYEVKFFDVNQLADSYVKKVSPAGFSKLIVYKTMNTTQNLKKAAAVLPDEIEIKAESGYTTTIKVSGNWVLDEENKCYVNKADKASLPSNITDKLGKLDKITVPYEISDDRYDAYNSLSVRGTIEEGNSIQMAVYRTLTTSKHSRIFKIQENNDGTYKGLLKFDRYTSSEYDKEASENSTYSASDIYNFGTLKVNDSGEYISIYYDDDYQDYAYLSTSIKKLDVKHKYEETVVKPTCTEDGYTEHKCSVCGDTYKDAKTEKLGHKYEETVVKPTCTEDGYTEHKCSVCGDTYQDAKIEKLGHKYEETVVKPTCTEDGYTEHKCSVCGDTYQDAKIEKLGHKYEETVVKPTCTEDGYTEHKCSVCGDTYQDAKIEKLGHKYEETVIEPTCTEDGYTLYECSVCGYKYAKKSEKLGHIIKVQNIQKATYFTTGYTGDTICTRCGETLEKGKKIPKLILKKPNLTTTSGKKKIKLVINKVTNATKYEIKVQLGKKTKTYYTTKTKYTLKKLKSKKKYTIKIRAMKILGNQKVYSSSVRKKVKVK